MDIAEEHLIVHGSIEEVTEAGRYVAVRVGFRIHNSDQGADTTKGDAIVLLDPDGGYVVEVDDTDLPDEWRVDTSVREVGDDVPAQIREMAGVKVDVIESVIPVDLSRLRLMADAVMNIHPWHYHPGKAAEGPFGGVVAMPLYPLHGLESWPDAKPFDPDPESLGREAVTDIGRLNPVRLGVPSGGIFNGGNDVEIHSLARARRHARRAMHSCRGNIQRGPCSRSVRHGLYAQSLWDHGRPGTDHRAPDHRLSRVGRVRHEVSATAAINYGQIRHG